MAWKCENCKRILSDDLVIPEYENVPYGSTTAEWYCGDKCGYCGSDEISEVTLCCYCEEAEETESGLCDTCYEDFIFELSNLLKKYGVDADILDTYNPTKEKETMKKKNKSFLALPPELRAGISQCHAIHKSAKDYDRKAQKKAIIAYKKGMEV